MKSERRHELHTNWLADRLGQHIEKVQPYSKALLGGLILILAVSVVLIISKNSRDRLELTAWNESITAINADDLETLGSIDTQYPGTNAAVWARLISANAQAEEGMSLLYSDRGKAQDSLQLAGDSYETLIGALNESQRSDPFLAGRAHFQLGKVREVQQDYEDAIRNYLQVVESWPDHAIGKRAQASLDLLERRQAARFYEEFYDTPPLSSLQSDEPLDSEEEDDFGLSPEPDIQPGPFRFGDFGLEEEPQESLPGSEGDSGESSSPDSEGFEGDLIDRASPFGEEAAEESPPDTSPAPANDPPAPLE